MRIEVILAALALAAAPTFATAAETVFPDRPIRMLVPYPAGGSLDLPGRAVGIKFSEATGQQLVLDNRGGAGGLIAGEIVARATPDGYTLILASNGQVSIAPALYPKLPYDPTKELVPITHFVDTPMVLFANAAFPAQSVKDLITMAKADPGKYGVALAGVGGVSHLTLELFKIRANINLLPVPYRGAGAAMGDIAGGTVPMIFTGVAAAKPLLDTARVRAIAVCSRKRTGSLPNVPTFEELGVKGMVMSNWFGVVGPKNLPPAIVTKLNQAINQALQDPEIKEKITQGGNEVGGGDPAAFAKFIAAESDRWAKLIKAKGIKPE